MSLPASHLAKQLSMSQGNCSAVRTAFPLRPLGDLGWRLRVTGLSLVLAIGVTSFSMPVRAQATPEATRDEARERFDRGLRLFNQQDNQGALAEFTRAYELVPHGLVLYNIGLVYAAMGRPVQAVEAFDRLLATPGAVDASKLERVRRERAEQAALIGEVEVATSVNGALVEVDGVEAGKTPLSGPLRIASGSHVVGVIAPGYAPLRKSVMLPGGTKTRLAFELQPQEAQLAHLEIRTRIPSAEVYVDGELMGRTPLPASLSLAPGARRIELRRAGYTTETQTVNLGAGSTGSLSFDLRVDPVALGTSGGEVVLEISEPNAVVFLDGESRGPYSAPFRVPVGQHALRVERGEFFPVERQIDVPARGRTLVEVDLEPTPEKRARYRSAAQTRRIWGYVSLGAGALFAGGGAAFLAWNAGEKSDKKTAFDREAEKNEPGSMLECDPRTERPEGCEEALNLALTNLEDARSRDVFGWLGVGLGGAAVGTGLFLVLAGDDPDRYEPKPESDVFGRLRLSPSAWLSKGNAGVSLSGRF
jgi:hypothetical protein